jgi:nitrite reductase (NADH) large subunit
MYKWCDRVGLDAIRKQVLDDLANRKALFARFAYSQQFAQSDPWAERARQGVDSNEFKPLAELELA